MTDHIQSPIHIDWVTQLRLLLRSGNGLPYDDLVPAQRCEDCDGPCQVCRPE